MKLAKRDELLMIL